MGSHPRVPCSSTHTAGLAAGPALSLGGRTGTAQPIAPVIPSSGLPIARQHARSAAAWPLPLARPETMPSTPADMVYGIGRIDASGRIANQAVISALGWRSGDQLTLTADAGMVTVRRDPAAEDTRSPAGQ